jgi:hypothetical protein
VPRLQPNLEMEKSTGERHLSDGSLLVEILDIGGDKQTFLLAPPDKTASSLPEREKELRHDIHILEQELNYHKDLINAVALTMPMLRFHLDGLCKIVDGCEAEIRGLTERRVGLPD